MASNSKRGFGFEQLVNGDLFRQRKASYRREETLGNLIGDSSSQSPTVVEEDEVRTMQGYERCGGGRRLIRKKIGGD